MSMNICLILLIFTPASPVIYFRHHQFSLSPFPGTAKTLNSVSSQCALDKSSIARKPEVHPKILSGKNVSKR